MQGVTKEAALLAPGLGGKQEVVDIDVNDRERFRADRAHQRLRPAAPNPTKATGEERDIRRRGLGDQFQRMNLGRGAASRGGGVRKVTRCLCERCEEGGALDPPHGQGQGEGNERRRPGEWGRTTPSLGISEGRRPTR
jgi:phage FluMu gp28-like protein